MKLACLFFSFILFSSAAVSLHQDMPAPVVRALSSNSNVEMLSSSNFDGCHAHFKDSVFPELTDDEYFKKKYPISTWVCLYSGEVFEAGYDTQYTNNKGVNVSSSDNKIIYDYEHKTWISVPDELYQSDGETNHLDLTLIKGGGFSGYMVVNKKTNAGESMYFCLIRKYRALCGSGKSDKYEDISQTSLDTLRLLNSIKFDDD